MQNAHGSERSPRAEIPPILSRLISYIGNLLQRAPNEKWVTAITYIPTMQGWLYLAVILDLYSRMVVGWSMSGNCDEKLVEHALDQALARRCPQAGLLHHSDRGSQYTSQAYQACLERSGIQPSMSRKGRCPG